MNLFSLILFFPNWVLVGIGCFKNSSSSVFQNINMGAPILRCIVDIRACVKPNARSKKLLWIVLKYTVRRAESTTSFFYAECDDTSFENGRQLADRVYKFFSGDIRKRRLHHDCVCIEDNHIVGRCHPTDAAAREEAETLLDAVVDWTVLQIQKPARNRWGTRSACNAKLTLGTNFYSILPTAYGRTLGVRKQIDAAEAHAQRIGDEHKLTQCVRLRKGGTFLNEKSTPSIMMAQSIITTPTEKLLSTLYDAEHKATERSCSSVMI
jgi:hypothetical protein